MILFLSPDPGDGKSTLVADLALVQRDAGERVVVVEANFRRPVQARLLGLEGARGLAAVLTGRLGRGGRAAGDAGARCGRRLPPRRRPTRRRSSGPVGSLFVLGGIAVPTRRRCSHRRRR